MNFTESAAFHREPEAAAVYCAHLTSLHHLKPSQNFIICDAGGVTVVRVRVGMNFPTAVNFTLQDLAVYKFLGELQNLEIAELCARSGANCGSIFLFVSMESQSSLRLTLWRQGFAIPAARSDTSRRSSHPP